MRKTWRKSLALFCALALIFSMMPTAFADFDDDNNVQNGEYVEIVQEGQNSPEESDLGEDENSEDGEAVEPDDDLDESLPGSSDADDGSASKNDLLATTQMADLLFSDGDSTKKDITIFYTSDLHGAFTRTNFATGGTHAGLARVATLLKSERAQVGVGNYITLDLGDLLQGAGSSSFIGNDDYTFPVIKGLNYLDYDATILGNHEFNYGLDNMYDAYNGAGGNSVGFTGDKLTGNVFYHSGTKPDESAGEITGSDPLLTGFAPYAVYTVNGIEVAVIGMTHPGADVWDAVKLDEKNIYTESVTTATIRAIDEIKDGDLADIIVLAVHTSRSDSFGRDGSGAESILANDYVANNVDVFLGAHGHSRTDNRVINGVRYVENSSNGGSMGIVTLSATQDEDTGKWYIADKTNDVRTVARVISTSTSNANYLEEDADYLAHMAAEIAYAQARVDDKIGTLVNGNMVPDREIAGSNPAYLQPTKLVSFINEVQTYYSGAQISGACAFNNSVQHLEGDITRGSLIGIYNYDSNTVYRLEMKGWQVKAWMEWAVGGSNQYSTFNPATDLTIRHNTSYRSDQFSGVEYTVDLTQPAGSRITITAFTGDGGSVPFDNETVYTVAANDYRASSGILPLFTEAEIAAAGGYPNIVAVDCNLDLAVAPDIISLMTHYISVVKGGNIDATDFEENWEFINLDWNETLRAKALELIAAGTLSYSTSTAVTVAQVMAAAGSDSVKTVDIYSFNDFHGTVDQTASSSNPGAAKFVAGVKAAMAESTGDTLLLAAGDNYQGSAMSNILVGEPITEMFKTLGVQYSAVGNHEYDWDPTANMTQWAADADMTFLAANIFIEGTTDQPTYCEPYAVVTLGSGIKIGLIGLATPLTPSLVTASNVAGLEFSDDYAGIVAPLVEYLRDDAGCDAVIALTHLGSSMSGGNIGGEVRTLINEVPDLDAVITGHTHATVAGFYNGVPVVQGGYNGRRLSKLAFIFMDGELLSVTPSNISMPTNSSAAEDPAMKNTIDRLTLQLAPLLSEVVGEVPADRGNVSQYFNNAVYEFIEDEQGAPYVFIQNSGGYRISTWPEQDAITMSYMYTIMPFDNSIVYMTMEGQNLIKVLNGETTLRDSGRVTGTPVVSGAYKTGDTWYLTSGDIEIANDSTVYNVACNDFMFTGGDYYDFTTVNDETYSSTPVREAMVAVLKARMTDELGAVLTSIYTNDGVLTPAFSPTVNSYSITIPYATSLNLDVKASVATAPQITGNENFTTGENIVTITLPVGGGEDVVYTVTVTVSEATATLAVLSTTDMHGRIWDVNPLDNSTVYNSMLSAATIIEQTRSGNDFSIVIDNGDLIQGSAMTSYNVNAQAGVENPMAIALRYIGYDAFVPGNHEFNYTLSIQEKFYDILLDDTGTYPNAPVTPIAANILDKVTEAVADPFKPYIIREFTVGAETFKVGILGFENVNVPNWDPEAHYEGMKFSSDANVEQSYVYEWETRWRDELQSEGCDIVVISMHTGRGSENFSKENQARYFIENSSGFDLVIGGHDHSARVEIYNDANGEPVYFVNGGGSNVTETLITLSGDGTYTVDASRNISLGSRNSVVTPDAGLVALMEPYYDATVLFVEEPIGTLAGEWDNIGNFFVNQADGQNLVHEAQLWAAYAVGGADVSISGPVNRSSWQPGQLFAADAETANISLKDLYMLYRYDNNLYYVIEMTGAQLKSWMEETAKYYSVNSSGNVTGSGFGLDTFYGVSYDVYAGNPVGSRVQNITYNGQPLSDTEILKVALCSYRLSATAENDEFGWFRATGLTASGDHVLYVGAENPEFGSVGGSVTLVIGEYIKAMAAAGKQITPPEAISSWAVYPTTYTAPSVGGDGGVVVSGPSGGTGTETPEETLPTITTPADQPAVENEDGTITLPGGGTVETPNGVVVDAPAGTVVSENGTVTIPDATEAQVALPDEAATVTVPGGSTINVDGNITVGDGEATVTTPNGFSFTLAENSVIVPDAGAALGFYVSRSMNFIDVASSAWYYDAVNYVHAFGLMGGTGGNRFSPDIEMNRAMLVTVLWRMNGMPDVDGTLDYADVLAGSWYETAVVWATQNGIVTGYSSTSFGPDDSITREQLAAILYRYCEFMSFDMSYEADMSSFADASDISDWASTAMAWACGKGIITGRSASEVAPLSTASRAEVATVLQRFLSN